MAVYFGKRHADILRVIDGLECSPEFAQRNFASCPVPHPTVPGRVDRSIDITKDGFVFLVMGFTGRKAAAFKEAYIARFSEMEARLKAEVEAINRHPHNHLTRVSSASPSMALSRDDGSTLHGRSGPLGYILPGNLNRPLAIRPVAQQSRFRNLSAW